MVDHQDLDHCEVNCIHEEAVAEVRQKMLGENEAGLLAEIFKTLGDPTRVKMLFALMNRELCVCDLAAVIRASDSAVSHQLRILRSQKLVKFRRDGKVLYYSLADDHVSSLFKQGLEHVGHSEEWAAQMMGLI
ncbi:MAG TPA: metalloregulator ArsR/SmtB family transcription factor [Syntrophomonadaceae bacterium]|nr:metalloregulator ArsR/SmtB family transcription factor [Syntrophomonadaceae bacterium]